MKLLCTPSTPYLDLVRSRYRPATKQSRKEESGWIALIEIDSKTYGFLLKKISLCIELSSESHTMISSFSWQLQFLLFLSIPIAYANWNFDPKTTDNRPSSPLPGFATNNGFAEYPPFDPAISDDRVKDISVTAPDQSQRNTISNEVELTSYLTDGLIPEGPIMAEGEGCLPKNGQSSRKMRIRRDQGVCEWNAPQQLQNVPQTPNTEQRNKPQGQITGGNKPSRHGKKRKTQVTVIRVNTPAEQAEAEKWFPEAERPKSNKVQCRAPDYDIPVCAYYEDSVEMVPAVMGLGPICILVPATACMFPLPSLQLSSTPNLFTTYIYIINLYSFLVPCVDRQIEWCCQLVEVAHTVSNQTRRSRTMTLKELTLCSMTM